MAMIPPPRPLSGYGTAPTPKYLVDDVVIFAYRTWLPKKSRIAKVLFIETHVPIVKYRCQDLETNQIFIANENQITIADPNDIVKRRLHNT
jgi:hypothetical protein